MPCRCLNYKRQTGQMPYKPGTPHKNDNKYAHAPIGPARLSQIFTIFGQHDCFEADNNCADLCARIPPRNAQTTISAAAQDEENYLSIRDSSPQDLLVYAACKIVDDMISFGAFRVEVADGTHLTCTGIDPMTHDAFLRDFVADNAYVLQRNLTNHPELARYAPALATVRMVGMVTDDQVFCPLAIIKLPQGNNIADTFWRPGNLASEVDVATGRIVTVAERAGLEVAFHDDHPQGPGLMGLQLPHWDELIKINARAARIFRPDPLSVH